MIILIIIITTSHNTIDHTYDDNKQHNAVEVWAARRLVGDEAAVIVVHEDLGRHYNLLYHDEYNRSLGGALLIA